MSKQDAGELLPCPFCGAKPHRGLTKPTRDQLHGDALQRYRIRCPHDCASISAVNEEIAIMKWNTRALPAAPQAAQRGDGRVKPLDWHETFIDRGAGSSDPSGWEADSGFGPWYLIFQYFGSDSYGWEVEYDSEKIGDVDDPEKAKEIAQEHFAKRVLGSLSPVQAGPVVAWECTDQRYPIVLGIVTTSQDTLKAWQEGGIKHTALVRSSTGSAEA